MRSPSNVHRLAYLPYLLMKLRPSRLHSYVRWVREQRGTPALCQLADIAWCAVHYSMSTEDYFIWGLYCKSSAERAAYAGTGAFHDFHSELNAAESASVFRSKELFWRRFGHLMGRDHLCLRRATPKEFAEWIEKHREFVVKPDRGSEGRGVRLVQVTDPDHAALRVSLLADGLDLAEQLIVQHPALVALSPSSVNTVRVTTVLVEDRVHLLGCTLRMSVSGLTDNLGQGGLAAVVNPETGRVSEPAVYLDPRKPATTVHPITRVPILGFTVPYWEQVLALSERAARIVPEVRTVGWDVALTSTGPILVEGNDNWGRTLVQLPGGEGKLARLRAYAAV